MFGSIFIFQHVQRLSACLRIRRCADFTNILYIDSKSPEASFASRTAHQLVFAIAYLEHCNDAAERHEEQKQQTNINQQCLQCFCVHVMPNHASFTNDSNQLRPEICVKPSFMTLWFLQVLADKPILRGKLEGHRTDLRCF